MIWCELVRKHRSTARPCIETLLTHLFCWTHQWLPHKGRDVDARPGGSREETSETMSYAMVLKCLTAAYESILRQPTCLFSTSECRSSSTIWRRTWSISPTPDAVQVRMSLQRLATQTAACFQCEAEGHWARLRSQGATSARLEEGTHRERLQKWQDAGIWKSCIGQGEARQLIFQFWSFERPCGVDSLDLLGGTLWTLGSTGSCKRIRNFQRSGWVSQATQMEVEQQSKDAPGADEEGWQ